MAIVFPFHAVGATVTMTASTPATYDNTWQILDIKMTGTKRGAIPTSHMGTAAPGAGTYGNATFIPSKITDAGQLELTLAFDASKLPPTGDTEQTTVITFPSGTTANSTFTGLAFVTEFSVNAPMEDEKATANLVLKWNGPITHVVGS